MASAPSQGTSTETIPPATTAAMSPGSKTGGEKALRAAAVFWFLMAVIGQWVFVYYIAVHYGGSGISGDFETFNANTLQGQVPGDTLGNLFFAAHVLMAAIITFGGTLQLIPQIRKRALNFHRWNGRVFILTAYAISIGGLYLILVRGATTSLMGSISLSINAVLIFIFATLAIRHARARKIVSHRRWALRTFMVVSGVWFFRVGLFAWIIANQGPVGIGENFDGPFVVTLGFAQYLLPLAVLELYFRAQAATSAGPKYVMAASLVVLTLLMLLGIFGAFMFMWKPFL